jgi:hypothetical protein
VVIAGISLPSMCESQKTRSRILIAESLLSSSKSKSSIHSELFGAPGPYGSHIAELGAAVPAYLNYTGNSSPAGCCKLSSA